MLSKNKEFKWIDIRLEELFSSKLRVKIINILVKKKEINISSLVKETRSNHTEVLKHINYLKEINLIEDKYFGRIHIIRLKYETLLGKIINDFFSAFA
ncbi:MAG: hypothetical protein ACTSRA_07785 [Promethearchaeota archaeon]